MIAGNYGQKCDIWSCGVIAYLVLSGKPPFYGDDKQKIINKVSVGKFSFKNPVWDKISDSAKDFVKWLLTFD